MTEIPTDTELMTFWQKQAGNFRFCDTVDRWNRMPLYRKQKILDTWKLQKKKER